MDKVESKNHIFFVQKLPVGQIEQTLVEDGRVKAEKK